MDQTLFAQINAILERCQSTNPEEQNAMYAAIEALKERPDLGVYLFHTILAYGVSQHAKFYAMSILKSIFITANPDVQVFLQQNCLEKFSAFYEGPNTFLIPELSKLITLFLKDSFLISQLANFVVHFIFEKQTDGHPDPLNGLILARECALDEINIFRDIIPRLHLFFGSDYQAIVLEIVSLIKLFSEPIFATILQPIFPRLPTDETQLVFICRIVGNVLYSIHYVEGVQPTLLEFLIGMIRGAPPDVAMEAIEAYRIGHDTYASPPALVDALFSRIMDENDLFDYNVSRLSFKLLSHIIGGRNEEGITLLQQRIGEAMASSDMTAHRAALRGIAALEIALDAEEAAKRVEFVGQTFNSSVGQPLQSDALFCLSIYASHRGRYRGQVIQAAFECLKQPALELRMLAYSCLRKVLHHAQKHHMELAAQPYLDIILGLLQNILPEEIVPLCNTIAAFIHTITTLEGIQNVEPFVQFIVSRFMDTNQDLEHEKMLDILDGIIPRLHSQCGAIFSAIGEKVAHLMCSSDDVSVQSVALKVAGQFIKGGFTIPLDFSQFNNGTAEFLVNNIFTDNQELMNAIWTVVEIFYQFPNPWSQSIFPAALEAVKRMVECRAYPELQESAIISRVIGIWIRAIGPQIPPPYVVSLGLFLESSFLICVPSDDEEHIMIGLAVVQFLATYPQANIFNTDEQFGTVYKNIGNMLTDLQHTNAQLKDQIIQMLGPLFQVHPEMAPGDDDPQQKLEDQ